MPRRIPYFSRFVNAKKVSLSRAGVQKMVAPAGDLWYLATSRIHVRHMQLMKRFRRRITAGFTMIELMVVIAIISLMMVMAASVLRDPGKGRSMDSAIDMMESLVREARATAQGNDTYTRIIIANDPSSATARDSRHLRFMTVQMFRKNDGNGAGADGTDVVHKGKWVSTSAGVMLPSGVYFSPHYSRPVEWMDGEDGLGQDSARLSNKGSTKIYCIEFDEKGRFAAPGASPGNPTRAQRMVFIYGHPGSGKSAKDGIIPASTDNLKRPAGAKGVVVWPNGNTTRLRTIDETIQQ